MWPALVSLVSCDALREVGGAFFRSVTARIHTLVQYWCKKGRSCCEITSINACLWQRDCLVLLEWENQSYRIFTLPGRSQWRCIEHRDGTLQLRSVCFRSVATVRQPRTRVSTRAEALIDTHHRHPADAGAMRWLKSISANTRWIVCEQARPCVRECLRGIWVRECVGLYDYHITVAFFGPLARACVFCAVAGTWAQTSCLSECERACVSAINICIPTVSLSVGTTASRNAPARIDSGLPNKEMPRNA